MPERIPEAQPCPEERIIIIAVVRVIVLVNRRIILTPIFIIVRCDLDALSCVSLIDHGAACHKNHRKDNHRKDNR
jgi:hypothetical protein